MNKVCLALWNGVKTENNGLVRPCCVFEPQEKFYSVSDIQTSEYYNNVRARMLAGESISECNKCWLQEQGNVTSLRMVMNQDIIGVKNVPEKTLKNLKNTKTVLAEVSIGNRCNFQCSMCSPGYSSLIYNKFNKNRANEFVVEYAESESDHMDHKNNTKFRDDRFKQLKQVLAQSSLKTLKLLGGEPLLENELIKILRNHKTKQKLKLYFTTNGSVNFDVLSDLLDYRAVYITVSLDGFGIHNDYIRRGSKWSEIENNILKFKERLPNNFSINAHTTLQALNANTIYQLIDWCQANDISQTFYRLQWPDYMSCDILDEDYIRSVVPDVIKDYALSNDYKHELRKKFLRYIDFYENDFDLKLKNVNPELYERIKDV